MHIYFLFILFCFSKNLILGQSSLNDQVILREWNKINEMRGTDTKCKGYKIKGNLPSLNWDKDLAQAALLHAKDMAAKKYFAHVSPSGKNFTYWVDQTDYPWKSVGENLAQFGGYELEEQTPSKSWKESADHCENIMTEKYKDGGLAYYKGYWVLFLGRTWMRWQ
jgi:uncharacterized protein YkwD